MTGLLRRPLVRVIVCELSQKNSYMLQMVFADMACLEEPVKCSYTVCGNQHA
jgi:hypothetical protein